MQLNEAAKNDSALRVGSKQFHVHQNNRHNKFCCSALGMEHCHSRQLSCKEANQIVINYDLVGFLAWQLTWMTMLYAHIWISEVVACNVLMHTKSLCTHFGWHGMHIPWQLHPRCTIWRWYHSKGYEQFLHISAYRAAVNMYVTPNSIRTIHLNRLQ